MRRIFIEKFPTSSTSGLKLRVPFYVTKGVDIPIFMLYVKLSLSGSLISGKIIMVELPAMIFNDGMRET